MTDVTIIGPPESNGGVGQYTSDFAEVFNGEAQVRRLNVGFNPVAHTRVAVATARDDSQSVHIQFVYSFLGPASVLSVLFFPLLYALTRANSKKLVVTLHEVWGETEADNYIKKLYVYIVHALLLVFTDHVTFLSDNAQERFHRRTWPGQTSVVPHGVNRTDTRKISNARSRFGFESDDIVISQHGYVNPRKGVETFFSIAEYLPDYEFLLAGGPRTGEHEEYFRKIQEMAPENVTVTGVLETEGFHAAFNATDLVVLPYKDINQSGIFNWCAAYGIPTIATSIPYFKEINQEWNCPLTFQSGSTDEAAILIKDLCEEDSERRTHLQDCMSRYARDNSLVSVTKWFDEECYQDGGK